ncbi:MAG: hypothetical protein ACK47C_20605 [Paracoccaceae bacterium]
MELIFLFGGPVIGGIVWAYMLRGMIPNLGSLVAYLIGSIVSLGVPFGVVMLLASTASTGSGAASLLQLSAYVCAFLGLMAFLVTFVFITSKESNEE